MLKKIIYVYIYIVIYIYKYMWLCTYYHIYTNKYMYTCIYTYIRYMNAYVYTCIYIPINICIYIFIHITHYLAINTRDINNNIEHIRGQFERSVRVRVGGGSGVETTQQREHIQYEQSLCEWAGGWLGGRVVE